MSVSLDSSYGVILRWGYSRKNFISSGCLKSFWRLLFIFEHKYNKLEMESQYWTRTSFLITQKTIVLPLHNPSVVIFVSHRTNYYYFTGSLQSSLIRIIMKPIIDRTSRDAEILCYPCYRPTAGV